MRYLQRDLPGPVYDELQEIMFVGSLMTLPNTYRRRQRGERGCSENWNRVVQSNPRRVLARTELDVDGRSIDGRKGTPVKSVRISAKAIVIQGGRILLLEHADTAGAWYGLPGGGQEHGETLEEALIRECREETRVDVRMGHLLLVREYIGKNHEFAADDGDAHQVELMFECEVSGSSDAGLGPVPDGMQTGVAWVPLEEMRKLRFYPKEVARILADGVPGGNAVYLGDVN